ncbi:hypothetical protein VT84_11730 [Gemmata sp. SH-PL17]|uniref:LysR family transcriptional regulator n=1 Tax=Gemmata sp. SH-PL17 TaxID=1630693 RepID=UPI00078DD763|nr:LysR family transcriptional regulator [Gemmata sp. SH-PL17]AMV25059.1 hypothetical protein VT84_11730 [Gemmata sp. SH-PL17]
MRAALGLDEHGYSSSVVEQVVTATARFASFRDATDAVRMAGIAISESQVRRRAHEVGAERIGQRDRKAIEHRRRQLPARVAVIPGAVAVEVDGGRIRTRGAERGPGVHEAQNKEDKVAALVTLTSSTFAHDPCPEPPGSFTCPRRVKRLVTQMKGRAGEAGPQEIPDESTDPATNSPRAEGPDRWSPVQLVRTCVASLEPSSSFGPMMAAAAQERHFYEARRRALVADGMAYNGSIHAGYFGDFEPIVDFLHVLCYVYTSACAVSADESLAWAQYLVWLRACWQGQAGAVLSERDGWQARVGEPPPGEPTSAEDRHDPRRLVAEARSYLRNNQKRMDYPRYRRAGLPTMSRLVESLVGEFNARVKDERKHWTRTHGAESILQLRAAVLSGDDRLTRFFANRPGNPFRKKRPVSQESTVQTAA